MRAKEFASDSPSWAACCRDSEPEATRSESDRVGFPPGCSVPDDHMSPRRAALLMAMRNLRVVPGGSRLGRDLITWRVRSRWLGLSRIENGSLRAFRPGGAGAGLPARRLGDGRSGLKTLHRSVFAAPEAPPSLTPAASSPRTPRLAPSSRQQPRCSPLPW